MGESSAEQINDRDAARLRRRVVGGVTSRRAPTPSLGAEPPAARDVIDSFDALHPDYRSARPRTFTHAKY